MFFDESSDTEIANAHTPKRIEVVAQEVGLHQDEFESYGKYKVIPC
jgi:formyltetrahydrofolate synthetase